MSFSVKSSLGLILQEKAPFTPFLKYGLLVVSDL